MAGKLFVVGTPIGNLGDMTPRAVETLSSVDFIAAEDTRVTIKLLNHFEIATPMISYYEHNLRERGEVIIRRILNGENCAIVTDAGMPAISDPGEDLVRLCHQNGIKIESVPGPTAMATALAMSGLSVGRFCFEGFLTTAKTNRMAHLTELTHETRTMVFYEAPHKLVSTLRDMLDKWGDREIALIKEITKLHENAWRTTFSEALAAFEDTPPKGEYVLIVEGAKSEETDCDIESAIEYAKNLVKDGMPISAAAKTAAKATGFKKGDIYSALLEARQ